MNREDRALEAYIQAVLPERERWLYQHALNKVRVVTGCSISFFPSASYMMFMMQIIGKELTAGGKNDKINCIISIRKDAIDLGGTESGLC